MSKRNDKFLLEDILESAKKIKKYCRDMDYSEFINDERTIDAVVRNFEIIGEAANRLTNDFKDSHLDIEWGN